MVVEIAESVAFVVELGEREFLFDVVLTDWTVGESICLSADLVQSRLLVRHWWILSAIQLSRLRGRTGTARAPRTGHQ